jgi:hypothetical protein
MMPLVSCPFVHHVTGMVLYRYKAMPASDITSLVANFREAARHLWNCHYVPTLDVQYPFDARDSFDRVARELFRSLVLEELDLTNLALAPASVPEPIPIPRLFVTSRASGGVPIFINRDRPRSGYWDHPKKHIRPNEATLLLARFFDFDEVGVRDFRYLEVFIAAASDPDIVGRWALLDFEYARISVGEPLTV